MTLIETDRYKMFHDYLMALAPGGEGGFTFQSFPDYEPDKSDEQRRRALTRQFHARSEADLPGIFEKLDALNAQNAGVFVTVNQTDLTGRKESNITAVRAYFVDMDYLKDQESLLAAVNNLKNADLPPSMVVRSKNGLHAFWIAEEGEELGHFREIQSGLIAFWGGDVKCKDPPRVLRLPGFFHCKNPEAKFPVRLAKADSGARYTAGELASAYPTPEVQSFESATRNFDPARFRLPSGEVSPAAVMRLKDEACMRWAHGSRHHLAISVAAKLAWMGVSEAEAEAFVRDLMDMNGDTDLPDRLTAVRTTYARYRRGEPVTTRHLRE